MFNEIYDIYNQMSQNNETWFYWGAVLLLLFPILTIVTGEIANRLKQTGHEEYSAIFYSIRNIVLPMVFLALLLHKLIGYDNTVLIVKVIDTLARYCCHQFVCCIF